MLGIYDFILGTVRELGPLAGQLERRDPELARQMRRAMGSVALNVAEGVGSRGKNRGARHHTALGSMRETIACLDVGEALGYLDPTGEALADRTQKIVATLVRLAVA